MQAPAQSHFSVTLGLAPAARSGALAGAATCASFAAEDYASAFNNRRWPWEYTLRAGRAGRGRGLRNASITRRLGHQSGPACLQKASIGLHIGPWGVAWVLRCAAMSRMTPLLLALVSALVWFGAGAAWAGTERSADGHLVRWDGGLEDMGRRAVRQIPLIDKQVQAALGFPLRGGPAEVVIVRGHERMQTEAGAAIPEWAGGVCVGARSRIVLRADRVEGGGLLRSMVTTLRHEWVHLSWSRRAGPHHRRLPL